MTTRQTLLRRIDGVRADMHYVATQLAILNGNRTTPRKPRATEATTGRPKSIATLQKELAALNRDAAWLHAEWIRRRGEDIFQPGSGADRLAELGIITPPQKTTKRRRGRPSQHLIGDALVRWTTFVKSHHPDWPITRCVQEAGAIIQIALDRPYIARESDYYRARRRLQRSDKKTGPRKLRAK